MDKLEAMEARRKAIIKELAAITRMRRGSVVEQYYEVKRRDGTVARQGPYYLYSYKEGGKTVSRRLTGPGEAERCREEIGQFRRFERLSAELIEVSQGLCDLTPAAAVPDDPKKKLRRPSGKKRSGRSRS
jgi:hypothetical protein